MANLAFDIIQLNQTFPKHTYSPYHHNLKNSITWLNLNHANPN